MASNASNLFSGTDFTDPDQISKALGKGAGNLFSQGSDLAGKGETALGPVVQRLMKLLSGNSSLIGDATRVETEQVNDAYTSARRNIANFAPRGAGSASAMTESRFKEASDVGKVRSGAVNEASDQLSKIGSMLLGTGANLEATSLSDIGNLLQSAIQQQGNNRNFWGSLGLGIGKIALGLGLGLTGVGAPAAGALFASSAGDFMTGGNNA